MCGRFVVSYSYDDLLRLLSDDFDQFDLDQPMDLPRYNIAPTEQVFSIINDGKKNRLGTLRWGFKAPNYQTPLINVRSETIDTKYIFKESFIYKRSILPVSGFYEWDRLNGKIPYYFKNDDDSPLYFAAIWGSYKEQDKTIYTTSILTKKATTEMADIHDRIPVILNKDEAKDWMNPNIHDVLTLKELIKNSNKKRLVRHQVSTFVNKTSHDSIRCITPYEENKLL